MRDNRVANRIKALALQSIGPWGGGRQPKAEDPTAASLALVDKVKELSLQPFIQPEPLPVIDKDEIILICWMAVDTAVPECFFFKQCNQLAWT